VWIGTSTNNLSVAGSGSPGSARLGFGTSGSNKKIALKKGRPKQMLVIKPPFTRETALAKIKAARDVWNIGAPDNRLEKTLWCYTDKQIGVSYEYELHDDSG
jgi:hypothetical protein